MITTSYLTPAQHAAIYRLLAQTPGLTVVPHVTNMKGQTGVGVSPSRMGARLLVSPASDAPRPASSTSQTEPLSPGNCLRVTSGPRGY